MEIEDLKLLVAVAREGSFAEAARQRRVAPSSVSRQVAKLEELLGTRLFLRSTRKLQLSEAGRAYVERVEPLIEGLEEAAEEVRSGAEEIEGRVRIAVATAFAHARLLPLLSGLARAHPKLQLELVLDAAYTDLVKDGIDVAIRVGEVHLQSVIAQRLSPMARWIVISPSLQEELQIEEPESLSRAGCLVFPFAHGRPTWKFTRGRGKAREVPVEPRLIVPDGILLLRLAIDGLGPALMPDWLVGEHVADGRLLRLFDSYEVRGGARPTDVWLVTPDRRHMPRRVRVVFDALKEGLRASDGAVSGASAPTAALGEEVL